MFRPLTVTVLSVVDRAGEGPDATVSAARRGIADRQLKAKQLEKRQRKMTEVTNWRRTGTLISERGALSGKARCTRRCAAAHDRANRALAAIKMPPLSPPSRSLSRQSGLERHFKSRFAIPVSWPVQVM